MKKKIVIALLCFFAWMLGGPTQAADLKPPTGEKLHVAQKSALSKKSHTTYFRVDGLACSFCAYGIEKKFKRMHGVTYVNVDFKKGIVIVKSSRPLPSFDKKKFFNATGFTYRCTVKGPQEKCR